MTVVIEALRVYRARFEPVRRDDLRPGMADYIGTEATFEAGWRIDDEDGGPYVGQWAMLTPRGWPCVWVPLCDLVDVRLEADGGEG
jgi:hypothetical protein